MSIINRKNRNNRFVENEALLLTANEFVEQSDVAQSVLNGWELHWGITDGGLSFAEDARVLEIIAEMSDEYEALLKPHEHIFRMRHDRCGTRAEWQLCLEVAERLKTVPVCRNGNDIRSYMQATEGRYIDNDLEESFISNQ